MAIDKRDVELAVDASAAMAELAVPGAGVAISLGKKLLDRVAPKFGATRRARGEEYLALLAEALEWDPEIAAALMDERMDDPVFQETVEEGYWRILSTWHELARRCITLLVADFVKLGLAPNRDYHLAAALLSSCDDALLHALAVVTNEYEQVLDAGPPTPGRRFLVASLDSNKRTTHEVWALGVAYNSYGGPKDPTQRESRGQPKPESIMAAVRALDRNDFGSRAAGTENVAPAGEIVRPGEIVLTFTDEHDRRMRALLGYLAPVRAATVG